MNISKCGAVTPAWLMVFLIVLTFSSTLAAKSDKNDTEIDGDVEFRKAQKAASKPEGNILLIGVGACALVAVVAVVGVYIQGTRRDNSFVHNTLKRYSTDVENYRLDHFDTDQLPDVAVASAAPEKTHDHEEEDPEQEHKKSSIMNFLGHLSPRSEKSRPTSPLESPNVLSTSPN